MNKLFIILSVSLFHGTHGRSLYSSSQVSVSSDIAATINRTEDVAGNSPEIVKEYEELFYIYFPLGIVNGSLEIVGQPILYKASQLETNISNVIKEEQRAKRQSPITSLIGGALGGGIGGLVGSAVLSPLGPIGSAIGGGLGGGIGGAIGSGLGGGGPGGILLGGTGGAIGGSVGGLLFGPVGAGVLGLIGGGLGGAVGAIG